MHTNSCIYALCMRGGSCFLHGPPWIPYGLSIVSLWPQYGRQWPPYGLLPKKPNFDPITCLGPVPFDFL